MRGSQLLTALPTLPRLSVVDGLKYAKDHEWVKVDGDTVTVGITDFAQVRRRRSLPAARSPPATVFLLPLEPAAPRRPPFDRALTFCLQEELGDLVYVELPEEGSSVALGERFGVVESVKVGAAPLHGSQAGSVGQAACLMQAAA